MVWIEIIKGEGIIKDDMIENIDWVDPLFANDTFDFYAHVKGNKYLICTVDILNSMPSNVENMTTDEYSISLSNAPRNIVKKLVQLISEAKKEDNDQVLNLNEKFL